MPPEPKIPADLLRAAAVQENEKLTEAADVEARYAQVQADVAAFLASKSSAGEPS